MLIEDDKKRENGSVENSLMIKVKIKNEFEVDQEKNKKKFRKTYAQRVKERMSEYCEEKPFKIHAKRKKDNYGEILDVINNDNGNVKRKKRMKAQTKTVESKRAKTTIKHPSKEKIFVNKKWWKKIQNSCYLENLILILKKF